MEISGAKWINFTLLPLSSTPKPTPRMFIGEFHHAIDDKNRLQVPAKWRAQLEYGAVITKGFDGSLKCYPIALCKEIADKLATLPQSEPNVRAYVRQTLAGAVDVELDKLGRIVVPAILKGYAGITKMAVVAGLSDHFEVWDQGSWNTYVEQTDISSIQASTALSTIGI